MAGFKRQRRVYVLLWPEDSDYYGLEVRMRSLTFGEMTSMMRLMHLTGKTTFTDDELDQLRDALDLVSSYLVSWNLQDEEGIDVPATRQALDAEDAELGLSIFSTWAEAIVGVPAPKEPNSGDGQPSLVASIPMEIQSPSQTA